MVVRLFSNRDIADDDSGSGEILEATLVDITERKAAEEWVQSLAYYDSLTGLPNRWPQLQPGHQHFPGRQPNETFTHV